MRYKAEHPDLAVDVVAEVEKMLRCRDPDYGFLTYKCPECGEVKTIPLTCKSRICTSCGKKYADEWADTLASTLYSVTHRHMVFTIPEGLRKVLDENRTLLKILMDSVSKTMMQMVKERRNALPGIVCVLHLYGRDLPLNPHVHALATEGGLTGRGAWMPVTFLEYGKLRKIWQYHLLTALKKQMPKTKETGRLVDGLFKTHQEGFYIYATRRVTDARKTARYIGRYIRHPAIADSRITEFNPDTNTVTFWYQRNGGVETVIMAALEFIDHLVRLIPDKNLKLIRYYGLYARRARSRIQKMLTSLSRDISKPQPRKEPVKCPKCGTPMEFIAITRPS